MMVNRPEFHVVDAAAMLLGATPFSVYNTSPAEQIDFVMGDAGNRLVIARAGFADVVRQAGRRRRAGARSSSELDADADFDLEPHWRAVAPDDVLTLIYTSGTTGPPKGVEMTHANMLAELRGVDAAVPLRAAGAGSRSCRARTSPTAGPRTTRRSDLRPHGDAGGRPAQVIAVVRAGAADDLRRRPARVGEAEGGARGRRRRRAGAGRPRARLGLDQARWLVIGAAPTPVEVLEFFAARGIRSARCGG